MSEQRDEGIEQAEQLPGFDEASDDEFTPDVWLRLVELEMHEIHEVLAREADEP